MGIIGGMDVFNKIKESQMNKRALYAGILLKAETGETLNPVEDRELKFPTDHEDWLAVIESLEIRLRERYLRCFIIGLKANIEVAEIRDKERAPQQCYDALRIYEVHLNVLLSIKETAYLLAENNVEYQKTIQNKEALTPNEVPLIQVPTLPKELDTEKAKEVLQRALNAGILNENYQCLGLTMYQRREFAELASEELEIKKKWKVFETLWGIKGLAQVKMIEANPGSLMKIKALFPEEIEREKGLRKNIKKI